LHFDLRLEAEGALKSWAVPKGPPLTTAEKRLALMVEDHPLDYLHFEGIIPAGNYGAGTVMVWDEGTYHVPGLTDRQKSEQAVIAGLIQGRFHFVVHGKKLDGEFILVKTKQGKDNAWLLFRKAAGAAVPPVGPEDRSVLSARTMEEIARGAPARRNQPAPGGVDLRNVPKAPMPHDIRPMLAASAEQPFDHPQWLFEVKWDGYRAIAEIERSKVRLYSRNKLSFEKRYVPIVDALEHLGHDAVLDGEVVVLDEHGQPRFQMLQAYQKARVGTLMYQVFDILYLDGHDLRHLPLSRRKEILAQVLDHLPNVKLSEHIAQHGVAFYDAVSKSGLEGIIAKDARSRYQDGQRSKCWLKIKAHLQQEAVIGGFTEPKGARQGLGALVLGVYDKGALVYIGHAGTGMSDASLGDLRARLDGLIQEKCPFQKRPKTNAPVHWVEPRLVCEVSFGDWTSDGQMRHPVFLGLREDKEAAMVHREEPAQVEAAEAEEEPRSTNSPPPPAPDTRPNQQATVGGHVVALTNLRKVYWPEEGYTKGDLIDYYREVRSFILPYLKDRPQSLHRHPNGIREKSFFQKDMRRQPPPGWVETVEIVSEPDGKAAQTIVCQDEATLVYLANLGCIELNPWNARVGTLDQADYVLLDLDPEDIAFDRVVEAAQAIHKVLEHIGAESCCKTSGKRGLHIYIPFGRRFSHEQAKHFAELIAHIVHARLPASTSLVRDPRARQGRVYLDYLQNGKGKTLAAPYSARPYPGATVSAPLKWAEVRRGLDPARFTIKTMTKRLERVGDLWVPMLGPGIDLRACLERLGALLKKES
jgi:bifunctional non-homologous end joining protein LigD